MTSRRRGAGRGLHGLRLRPLPELLSAADRAGLLDDCQRRYEDYRLTGVFDRDILHRVARATGARYLAQPKLARFERGAKGRFGIFGLGVSQTQYAYMRVFLQIRDSEDASVAWEGIDGLSYTFETTRELAMTLAGVAREAAARLGRLLPYPTAAVPPGRIGAATRLPGGRQATEPCPETRRCRTSRPTRALRASRCAAGTRTRPIRRTPARRGDRRGTDS